MLSLISGGSLRFYQGLTADECLLSAKWISAKDILEVALVQPDCSWLLLIPVSICQHHLTLHEWMSWICALWNCAKNGTFLVIFPSRHSASRNALEQSAAPGSRVSREASDCDDSWYRLFRESDAHRTVEETHDGGVMNVVKIACGAIGPSKRTISSSFFAIGSSKWSTSSVP